MSELKVALIQSIQHWHNPAENRAHFGAKIAECQGADLVVLPEMFSTGFTMASQDMAELVDGPTLTWLQETADQHDMNLCGSVIIEEHGHYYNRFVLVSPGSPIRHYNKKHLFRMANEHTHFDAGDERAVFELNGIRICPQVCYDLRFPVFSRNRGDYDVLLYVANWPAARDHHWRTLLTARAIENQAYVIGLNRIGIDGNQVAYAGDSGVINANGDWLLYMGDDDGIAGALLSLDELNQYRENFPAWRDADGFDLTLPPERSQS